MAAKVGQVVVDFLLNTAKFETDIKKATTSFKAMGKEWSAAGETLTKQVTLPLVAAGAAVVAFANKMDEGMDTIRSKTGATGAAFTALGTSMRNVMTNVPQGVDQVSTSIADLNVRLGLSGAPLEAMATQMLNLSRITGTEVGPLIAASTRLFSDWSVATTNQSSTLDYLYKVSQSTGIGVDNLMQTVVKFGAPLRSLGFDLESAAAMMGKWEKEGVNMETALAGLRKGLATFAKAGVEPAAALTQMEEAIKGAKTESEAMTIAIQVFGAKAGPDLARAILEGRMSLGELKSAIAGSGDTINKAAADTMSFGEKMGILGNKIALAAEPLGNALLKAFDQVMPYIEKAIGYLTSLAEGFSNLPASVQATVIAVAAVAAAVGPLLMLFGSMSTGIATLLPLFAKLWASLAALPALMSGLSTAFVTAAGSITLLGQVAIGIGAFWVGWKLGELLNNLEWVRKAGDAVASVIMKIPGVSISTDSALKSLEGTTERLAGKLKSLGVNVDRLAGESIQAWNQRVLDAAKAHKELRPKVDEVSTAAGGLKQSSDGAAFSLDNMGKKTKTATVELKALTSAYDEYLAREVDFTPFIQSQINSQIHLAGDLGATKTKLEELTPVYTDLNKEIIPVNSSIWDQTEKMGEAKEATTALGNTISTTLTNMTQQISDKVTKWAGPFQDFASAALSALMEGLFNPIISQLTSVGNSIGNWLGGLLSGKGGGFSLGGLLGLGGSGASAAAGTGAAGAAGGAAGGAGGISGALGLGGGSGLFGLGAATIPVIGGAIVGAIFGGKALANWAKGPDSYEALSKEVARDLGTDISSKEVNRFLEAMGITEPQAWDHRFEIEQSPAFMAFLLNLGKTPHTQLEAFKAPLAWGAVNNQWGPYDELYSNWLGKELGVSDIPWQKMLIGNGAYPEDESKIPSYERGIDYVPQNQTAQLHEGERVISKRGVIDISQALQRMIPDVSMASRGIGTVLQRMAPESSGDSRGIASALNNIPMAKIGWLILTGQLGSTSQTAGDVSRNLEKAVLPVLRRTIPETLRDLSRSTGERTIPESRNTSIRGGDTFQYFTIAIQSRSEDLARTVKQEVIPIIKREMTGGNTGLREAVRLAYDTTARAF